MASDQQSIQGLWRLVSCIARGRPIGTATTHYHFDGNRVKDIEPWRVEGGEWSTFELDSEVRPKRFTRTSQGVGKDEKTFRRIDRWLYELDGDVLRLCWPSLFGDYPDALSDQTHGVLTLARYRGPPPETKKPSGKKPVEDAVLGRVTWNDDFDYWEARVELNPGQWVDVSIKPGEEPAEEKVITAGQEFVHWLRQHELDARWFAAKGLLELHNDTWNNAEPISARTFTERMTLGSVEVGPDGRGCLYFDDGDLFLGHCTIVSVSADRVFKGAEFAG